MSFATFEEIHAWQDARLLTQKIRVYAKRANLKKDWTWADQISKAALSVMANIAEGNDSNSNSEFVAFLSYAKRSNAEVRSHLYYGLDEAYISQEEFEEACALTKKIGAQLAKLMKHLQTNARPSQTSNQ